MSNFWIVFLLAFLFLIPPALILLGVLLRRERYGFQLFIIGWFITSSFLLPYATDLIAAFICRLLSVLGITASFHDTRIIDIPLFVLSIWGGVKVFRLTSNPHEATSQAPAKASSSPDTSCGEAARAGEPIYFMEDAAGMTVAVPESKMDAWSAHQEELRKNPAPVELTEKEKILRDMILERYYGSKEGGSDGKS